MISREEQSQRFGQIIQLLANRDGVSVKAICDEVGLNPKTISQRKAGSRGKRGVTINDEEALRKLNINTAFLRDPKPGDLSKYLPKNPISIIVKRRARLADDISELKRECTEMRKLLNLVVHHLEIESDTVESHHPGGR